MRVSHETIYQSLFVQGRGELPARLRAACGPGESHARRGARRTAGRIPGMTMISERPAEADDRAVPGHWEGDLIMGENSPKCGRNACRAIDPSDPAAAPARREDRRAGRRCDAHSDHRVAVLAGTNDHLDMRAPRWPSTPSSPRSRASRSSSATPTCPGSVAVTRTPTACCGSTSPRARTSASSVETNSPAIQESLNGRPRKTLGYLTPSEKFAELLVASTG